MNTEDFRYRNLVDGLLFVDIEKLTDDELEELAENIEKLTQKIALVMTVRYLVGGNLFNE
nr:MAG TPA: nucleoprotein [Caudoviricetes sp.]